MFEEYDERGCKKSAERDNGKNGTKSQVRRLQTVYEERNKEDLEKRLKRIEGQVRGIYRMIEEDRYCIDILNQIIAARAALSKVGMALLKSHMRGCVTHAIKEERSEQAIDELMDVLTKFAK